MCQDRIEELDVFRGICVLGMIAAHFLYDLTYFGGIVLQVPIWIEIIGKYGHLFFILLSGICVTLGRHNVQRGIQVFGAALLVSYVTIFMDLILGYEDLRIFFGILHLLGFSMIAYPVFKRLSPVVIGLLGSLIVALGIYFDGLTVKQGYLFPLGLCSEDIFTGSDYFPVFPNFGFFLLGAAAGKLLYPSRMPLLPWISRETKPYRFLGDIGRHSLIIYLLHQPVLVGLTSLIT